MYKKAAVVVPVFTASLVSSKEPSKDDLSNNECSAETKPQSPKQPKKHEICFGDPKIRSLDVTRQSRSRIFKSRSTLSILRLKSSYLRSRYLNSHNLRLCVSKSSDSRYFKSRSPTLSPSTSCSNSPRTGSPGSGSTYTVSDLKSVHSTPSGHRSPNSVSVRSSLSSLGSKSPFSESPASRPTYSTSHFYHTRLPVSKHHCRVASKLTASKPSCLKDPKSRSCGSKSPVSKPCLRSPAATIPSSKSPESRPPCLKSGMKSFHSRPPAPKKSCLRSPTSKSPENKPSCFRTPTSKSLNSKPSPIKRSCLKSPVLTSLSKKSSGPKSRCSHLETSTNKSPNQTSPAPRSSTASPQSRPPKSKSPCPKSVSFKSADSKSLKSRSPVSMVSPPRTPKSISTCSKPQFKDADLKSVQSKCPQRHLPGLVSPALRSHFLKPQYLKAPNIAKPRLGSPPPLNPTDSKCPPQKFPNLKDAKLAGNKFANLKRPDPKHRPRLAVSKIHVSRLSVKGSRGLRRPNLKTHDRVRKPSKSLVKLSDYKSVGQESRSKLTNLTKKDLNREYLEKLLATKMDVRYMLELKNCIEKIKSSFVDNMHVRSCDSSECTALKERLRRHRLKHHYAQHSAETETMPDCNCEDLWSCSCDSSECAALQERQRRHHLKHHYGQHPDETPGGNPGETKGSGAQTKITLADLGGLSLNLGTHPTSTNTAPDLYGRAVNDTGYKEETANDRGGNNQGRTTYNGPFSYAGGPDYEAVRDNQMLLGYEGVKVKQEPPGYKGRPDNQGRFYAAAPDYKKGSGYQEGPSYDGSPGYEPGPSYQKGSDYQGGPGYHEASAYQEEPGYKVEPVYKQEPSYHEGGTGNDRKLDYNHGPGFLGNFRDKRGPGNEENYGIQGTRYNQSYGDKSGRGGKKPDPGLGSEQKYGIQGSSNNQSYGDKSGRGGNKPDPGPGNEQNYGTGYNQSYGDKSGRGGNKPDPGPGNEQKYGIQGSSNNQSYGDKSGRGGNKPDPGPENEQKYGIQGTSYNQSYGDKSGRGGNKPDPGPGNEQNYGTGYNQSYGDKSGRGGNKPDTGPGNEQNYGIQGFNYNQSYGDKGGRGGNKPDPGPGNEQNYGTGNNQSYVDKSGRGGNKPDPSQVFAYERGPSEIGHRSGTIKEPGFEQKSGYKRIPGDEREPGYERAHDDKGRIGFLLEPDIKQEIDDKSVPAEKHGLGYEERPGDESGITDRRDPVDKLEPVYKRRPSFEQESGFVIGPGGRRETGYPRGPGYNRDPENKRGPNYGQSPITGQEPVSGRVQSAKGNSGNDQLKTPSYSLNRTVANSNSALNPIKTPNNSQNYDPNLRQNSNYLSNNQFCTDPRCNARKNAGYPNDTTYDLSYGSNKHVCAPNDACYPRKRNRITHKCGDELLPSCETHSRNKLDVTSCCSDTALKYTAISKNICGCPTVKNIVKHKPSCGIRLNNVEREISDWLKKCTFFKCNGLMKRQEIIDTILFYINPYLNQSSKSLNKAILKAKIINVLKTLNICGHTSGGMKMVLNKQTDDLANRLIGIVTRLESSRNIRWNCCIRANRPFRFAEQVHVGPNQVAREDLKHDLMQEFEYSLRDLNIGNTREVLENVTELIIDKIELLRRDNDEIVRNDIRVILENSYALTDDEMTNTVNGIIKSAREIVRMIINVNDRTNNTITARTCLSGSGAISIYTSEHEAPSFAAAGTSSPKKKKEVLKLSPEEKAYNDEIVSVVRNWIKTKPNHFKNLNDNKMNELMIHDLAGDIVDHVKLGQLIPDPTLDTKSIMTYYIYKWLRKFEILDDLEQAEPYIQELVKQMQAISVPQMTRSQYGTRQTMKNIKHLGPNFEGFNETFIPKAQDILEDEVSIWMNEYPSDIFVTKDKSIQNKLVHELADKLQKDENDKISVEDVAKHVKNWLKKVVKSKEKERIDGMSESLRERISKVPHDKTIAAKIKEKQDKKMQYVKESSEPIPENLENITEEENDNTMKQFIIKYVKHNYDEDDPLTKGAYVKLLKLELQRLSPQVLKEVYEGQPLGKFSPEKLFRELEYIKDISDWLKTLPVDHHYHAVGNKRRLDFIISLAREIAHLEKERRQTPDAMNYDENIGYVICEYMHQLPLKLQIGDSMTKYVHPIFSKIFSKREQITPPLLYQVWVNIADFVDDFVKLNGQDIANDEIKLEVWATRLVQEIKKMIAENTSSLHAADVRDRLAGVAKPGDETIERFNHELDYAKEISDWLKNFSLKANVDDEIIKDLAEKMAEYDYETDNSELVKYIKQWISSLPLDETKQIDLPLVIQQLLNRRTKVLKPNDPVLLPVLSDSKSSGAVLKSRDGGSIKSLCRGCCPVDDPGLITVQVIKDWCDELPLQGTEVDIKHARDNIASKLYQKIIEINDDPRLARNDMLYMDSLSDKIDELLDNFPQNVKLEGDKTKLKSELLKKIRQARLFSREVSLGDEYIRDLEDAIETALPKPVSTAGTDPGFELYKENLAEMFILENFDHGDDADKLKYKKKIKEKIDEFYPHAQLRNSVPADKLYNDILGVLFHVSMPIEKAMIDNVEEIKTKCVIEDWVEKLPLLPVNGPAEQVERDQRIRLLARKLRILGFEKDADQKIQREITKWLTNMPLKPGENTNIDRFANDLQEILKKTQKSRKCVTAADVIPVTSHEENSMWVNPNTTIDSQNTQQPSRLKTGDIIIDIVEKWCDNIPFPAHLSKDQTKRIKDDVTIQIIKKISVLNSGRNTFDDDTLYNHLLSQEIDKALAGLPQNDTLTQSKDTLKHQLVSAIDSVKPLIREDRARHLYKTELENTVASLLGALENATPEEQVLFTKIQEEIVDDFLEHQYNKDDDEGKEFYKKKMLNALIKYNYIGENDENRVEIISDSLVEVNRMLCELQKIIPPENLALKDEVEEIRMKQEVDNFLNKVSPTSHHKSIRRNSIKVSLARQLHEIEKRGHTEDNNQKMAAAVSRTLKKLNADDKDDAVKPFIDRLQKNESIRKAPPYTKHKNGNFSLPADLHESRGQHFDKGSLAQSWPLPPDMYESEYQKSLGPSNTRSQVGPSVHRPPVPISPTKALKDFMGYPPQNSITIDSLGGKHQEVEVSVYRRDHVPPNWAAPTPPPQHYPEAVFSNGLPIQQKLKRLTQPTQTSGFRPEATQTPSVPTAALPNTLEVPKGYGRPLGNYSQTQAENYGQPQVGNFNQPEVENFGRARVDNSGQPQASNAGVQSGPGYVPAAGELELTGDECLCDMCMKNPCEFIDYFESCESGLVPIFRRQMMLPPCAMMPPPFMY